MNPNNLPAAAHLTAHLTDDQFTDYTLGLSTEAMDLHIESCSDCRDQVLAVQDSINTFAIAAREWSTQQVAPAPKHFRMRALAMSMRPAVGFAAAAIAVFSVVTSVQHHRAPVANTYAMAAPHSPVTIVTGSFGPGAPASDRSQEPVRISALTQVQPVAPARVAPTQSSAAEIAQDNAMMLAIDAEISAPVTIAADSVSRQFPGQ